MSYNIHTQNTSACTGAVSFIGTDKPSVQRTSFFMKLIPLSKGLFAKVDDEDYEWIMKHKWCATYAGNTYYAKRSKTICGVKKSIFMHSEIIKPENGNVCDHVNRDGLDNQKNNLRQCTKSQNQYNRRSNGFSKYLGVSYEKDRGKWRASIKHGTIIKRSSRFDTETEAAIWYNNKAKELHKEFANLNIIRL